MAVPRPLIITSDAVLMDDLIRLAAAAGVEVQVAHDVESARRSWRQAPLVVVDMVNARGVAGTLARREGVLLVSRDPDPDAWRIAVSMGAEHVACLPDADRWLIGRLAEGGEGPSREGRVVTVTGAVGGAGASTLASGIALAAARHERVLLIDADAGGGGLDLVLGAEQQQGARWPDLAQAHGRINAGSLASALPCSDGVFVLSAARDGQNDLDTGVLQAVMEAGVRGFDLVIVDVPVRSSHLAPVLATSASCLVLVPNHTRAVVAARHQLTSMADPMAHVIMRADPRGLAESVVSEALQCPIAATVPWHRALPGRADDGESPRGHDSFARACDGLLRLVGSTVRRAA